MIEQPSLPLRIVDGCELPERYRAVLRPDEVITDRRGRKRRLPRYFYEVTSWEEALKQQLTPNFALWEFLDVDVRESHLMRGFPRYVPCAISLMAAHLQLLRQEVNTFVHIAANGGYRSPGHRLNRYATPHAWATAVNIYRIGDDWMDSREQIDRYNRLARQLLPGIWARPYGHGAGYADDHIHLDLGYVTVVPHGAPDELPGGASEEETE